MYSAVRTVHMVRYVWYIQYCMIHADRLEICGSFSSQLSLFRIWHYTHRTCGKYYTYSIVRMIRTVQTGHGCFEARLWYSTYCMVRYVWCIRYGTVRYMWYSTVCYIWYGTYGTYGMVHADLFKTCGSC